MYHLSSAAGKASKYPPIIRVLYGDNKQAGGNVGAVYVKVLTGESDSMSILLPISTDVYGSRQGENCKLGQGTRMKFNFLTRLFFPFLNFLQSLSQNFGRLW